MIKQGIVNGLGGKVKAGRSRRGARYYNLFPKTYKLSGFTLIETLVAISLLTVAIVAPMSLTSQALNSAYYARDQMTASYLAQEALEGVRNIRDNNILTNARGGNVDLMNGIPSGHAFTIDTITNQTSDTVPASPACPFSSGAYVCPQLQLDPTGTFYGYGSGWTNSQFTRSVNTCFVQADGSCTAVTTDEIKVTVTVSWQTGSIQRRTITLSENLYRWTN